MKKSKVNEQVSLRDTSALGCKESIFQPIKVRGFFTAKIREDGKEWIHHKENLIVTLGRHHLAALLGDAFPLNDGRMQQIRVGVLGHGTPPGTGDPLDVNNIVPPASTDIDLNDPSPYVIDRDTGTISRPVPANPNLFSFQFLEAGTPDVDGPQVEFIFVMEQADVGVTTAFTEAGLFSQSDIMFSRVTFPALVKNANRTILFEWVIAF